MSTGVSDTQYIVSEVSYTLHIVSEIHFVTLYRVYNTFFDPILKKIWAVQKICKFWLLTFWLLTVYLMVFRTPFSGFVHF